MEGGLNPYSVCGKGWEKPKHGRLTMIGYMISDTIGVVTGYMIGDMVGYMIGISFETYCGMIAAHALAYSVTARHATSLQWVQVDPQKRNIMPRGTPLDPAATQSTHYHDHESIAV